MQDFLALSRLAAKQEGNKDSLPGVREMPMSMKSQCQDW